ncbi:TatD family deoxyribonuclease [Aliidiomarina halalkaliphila]|uniref:TatD family deoxyribonuclease n=1 Tax=Aliidiomarina halalkaliphila TaxID=2593535 RepID=A0A552X6F2_9GAMM|nr:TatD family hydrolase [Aliidiomarina halalkaliphila]TRW50143.1 TatD family deoxyribonuclease [Aliidiomarina halalkaliphila]
MVWCADFLPGPDLARITDAHCHLDFPDFDDDRDAVLARARDAGVQRFLVPGVQKSQWSRLETLGQKYADWSLAYGLHPYFIEAHQEADLKALSQQLEKGAIALGEIGLDATVGDQEKQVHFFKEQLAIAAALELPVILHHRRTLDTLLSLVRQAGVTQGMVHAFSGSYEQAMAWIDAGFYLGVGGVITYERAQKTRAALARVPLQRLLLETDSPDMPLQGYQGQRNEPARVIRVRDTLRELRQL